ncbi:MAG: hypothetical protein CVU05_03525 [Bacteroidetes bacterium HGW-Bacteroidetes-21]|nr:MAG: hypothetical protein CVU05_03525 [Bacteroidetes bacterium HGW-Bacteroidetes-21]
MAECHISEVNYPLAYKKIIESKLLLEKFNISDIETIALLNKVTGYYYFSISDFDNAEKAFQKVIKNENEYSSFSKMYLGSISKNKNNFRESCQYFSEVMNASDSIWLFYSKKVDYEVTSLASLYFASGKRNIDNDLYKIIEQASKKEIFIDSLTKAYHFHCLGTTYKYFEDFTTSERYLRKALSLYIKYDNGYNNFLIAYISSILGYDYSRKFDFIKADYYYSLAFQYMNNTDPEYNYIKSSIWHKSAINSYKLKDYNSAIDKLDTAFTYLNEQMNSEFADLLDLYGLSYTKLQDYTKAEKYFQKAIKERKKKADINIYSLSKDYQNYSELLVLMGKQNEAVAMGRESCQLIRQAMGEKSGSTSIALTSLAGIYKDCGLYHLAKQTYNQAIQAACSDKYSGVGHFPADQDIVYPSEYIRALKGKATFLLHLSDIFPDKKEAYALQSLSCYLEIIKQLEKIKSDYQFDEGKLLLAENERAVYNEALKAVYEVFSCNKKASYLQIAFNIMERGKAALLLEKVSLLSNASEPGINNQLFNKDQELRKNIAKIERYIVDLKKRNPDPKYLTYINNKLYKLYDLQEKYYTLIKSDFPNYYNTWVNPRYISLGELQQKLDKNDCMIEYVMSDSTLYYFYISSSQTIFLQKELSKDFSLDLTQFIQELSQWGPEATTKKSFDAYTQHATGLYDVLIRPLEKEIEDKHLIIVRDGLLNYIPFEALTEQIPTNSSRPDYINLPYLIKKYQISYTNSATLYCHPYKSPASPENGLLAFAPEYGSPEGLVKDALETNRLQPLKGASEEVASIQNIYPGKLYSGTEATENEFKKVATNYKILHFAMHGESDNTDPLSSRLIFETGGNEEDGILNAWEIYNMTLNPELVVLSACNTGTGKLRNGEGVMSLARAFMYAGCPSVIMTLWSVSDLSSNNLMKMFYTNLSDGQDKAEALRQAKIKYLEETHPLNAHPYYWSGYVIIGDTSPMDSGFFSTQKLLLIISISVILLLMFLAWKKSIKCKKID